ncbi:MAG: ADP-ribosylation factor-like protein [Promethearchaeota archaeon]
MEIENKDQKKIRKKNRGNLLSSIVLSVFENSGPTPIVYFPEDMDSISLLLIAMKTISILMGESTYQEGQDQDGINYFGIIPFPDLKLIGLTYFFLIYDETARGKAKATTITLLIQEKNGTFFYENMKYLRVIFDKTASQIQKAKGLNEYRKLINEMKDELFEFTKDLKDPFSAKRKIKVLFSGLDRAGKTSFLNGINKKYSEIIKALPTKGVKRTEERLFAEQTSHISIWDLGGQRKYREKYLEQSQIYLYNIDLLFFVIDIQDTKRIEESLNLFKKILNSLKALDEYPPIIIILNKYDPDIKDSEEIVNNLKLVTKFIKMNSDTFFTKIFTTSIFDHWSLISAYSYGLSQLSPNRELFRSQLKHFAKKTKSDALLLLNENGIILSNYSKDNISAKVFEISAPHFQTLYKTFKEFKLLKQDFIVSSGITDAAKKVIFKKIQVNKYSLYLLLFMKESQGIENIERNLGKFSNNLAGLISTYI